MPGGGLCTVQPAHALLILESALVTRRSTLIAPCPDLSTNYPQYRLIVGVDGDDGVNEEALRHTIACRSEPLAASIMTGEVYLRCILNGDDAAAPRCCGRTRDMRFEDLIHADLVGGQQAMGRDLTAALATKLTHHKRVASHDPLQKPICPLVQPYVTRSRSLGPHVRLPANQC
jgi:hypothetical protein